MKIEEHRVITHFKKILEDISFSEEPREGSTVIFKRSQSVVREEVIIIFRFPSTMIIRVRDTFGDLEVAFKGRIPETSELFLSLLYLTRVN